MKTFLFTFIIAVLFAYSCQSKLIEKPNIVFILADDLGRHQIGAYGSSFYETPEIDNIAESGMKFTNAYAAATVCSPTRASIMTGKYPARLHITDFIPGKLREGKKLLIPEWTKFLPQDEVTIAELLKSHGYKTGHFGKWHLNKDKKYKKGRVGDPMSQGFDQVLTTHKPGAGPESKYPNDRHHVKEITEEAIKFIENNSTTPFFAYLTHNSIHAPEMEDESLIQKYEKKPGARIGSQFNPIQAAMLETLDKSIGRVVNKIDDLGLGNNTIIIFFSDNGQLGEKENLTFRGSKGDLYEGGIKMPLIIRWPEVVAAGSECDEIVISNDFFNTFSDIISCDDKSAFTPDGISLLPLLKKEDNAIKRKSVFWHYPHYHGNGLGPQGAIRKGNYKLIEWFEKSYYDEEEPYELYDLSIDPGERNNLAESKKNVVQELSKELQQWREEVGAQKLKKISN